MHMYNYVKNRMMTAKDIILMEKKTPERANVDKFIQASMPASIFNKMTLKFNIASIPKRQFFLYPFLHL